MKLSQRRMARPSLGGMLATRQGALILAVLCATCAAGVLVFALGSYKQNVQTVIPQSTVLVATGEIQQGTAGDVIASEKLYKSTPVVASQLVPGAISDSSILAGKIAQSDILPGQQLTTAEFTATVGATSLLKPNQRAISVPADEVHGDLDVLAPGDRVDLYAELSQSAGATISLLAPNVLVLKTPTSGIVGAATTAASTGKASAPAATGTTLVLAVSDSIVPALELTADSGKVWAALRPVSATAPAGGITTVKSILAESGLSASTVTSASNLNSTTTGTHP